MTETSTEKKFSIGKIYIKDLSFEAPQPLAIFREGVGWKPDTSVNLSWVSKQVGETGYELVLTVTVTAKLEDKTAYLVEVQQAALFMLQGYPETEIESLLSGYCPNILFPFARQAVADIVSKGGYPQLMLNPVDFEALYAANKKQSVTQTSGQNEEDNSE